MSRYINTRIHVCMHTDVSQVVHVLDFALWMSTTHQQATAFTEILSWFYICYRLSTIFTRVAWGRLLMSLTFMPVPGCKGNIQFVSGCENCKAIQFLYHCYCPCISVKISFRNRTSKSILINDIQYLWKVLLDCLQSNPLMNGFVYCNHNQTTRSDPKTHWGIG